MNYNATSWQSDRVSRDPTNKDRVMQAERRTKGQIGRRDALMKSERSVSWVVQTALQQPRRTADENRAGMWRRMISKIGCWRGKWQLGAIRSGIDDRLGEIVFVLTSVYYPRLLSSLFLIVIVVNEYWLSDVKTSKLQIGKACSASSWNRKQGDADRLVCLGEGFNVWQGR